MKIIIPLIDTYRQIYTNCREDMSITLSRVVASIGTSVEVLALYMFMESLCVLFAPSLRETLILKIRHFLNIQIAFGLVFSFLFLIGSKQRLIDFETGENYAKYSKKTGFYKWVVLYLISLPIITFSIIIFRYY